MAALTNWMPKRAWRPLSRWGLLLATCTGLVVQAPGAQAIEAVQLTYGNLEFEAMPLADLEAFIAANRASRDLQALLDLMKVEHPLAQAVLAAEWQVDNSVFNQAIDSFVANAFFELLGTAIELPDADVADWLALRNATVAAAADGRLSVLEILQNLEGRLLVIDTRQAIDVARDIRQDIRSLRALFNDSRYEEQIVEETHRLDR